MAASFPDLLRYIQAEAATLKALRCESLKAALLTGKQSNVRPGDVVRARYYKLHCALQLEGSSTEQENILDQWRIFYCKSATRSHTARTHGPGWRTAHASSINVKVL